MIVAILLAVEIMSLMSIAIFPVLVFIDTTHSLPPNGERYPRVGGTRERHFAGTNSKPRKLLENAQTPTRRVHAVLGSLKSYFLEDSFSRYTTQCQL